MKKERTTELQRFSGKIISDFAKKKKRIKQSILIWQRKYYFQN